MRGWLLLALTLGLAASITLSEATLVVLAVWYPVATELLRQHQHAVAGTTVVDITNPVDTATFDGLVTPAGSSAAEQLATLAPEVGPQPMQSPARFGP